MTGPPVHVLLASRLARYNERCGRTTASPDALRAEEERQFQAEAARIEEEATRLASTCGVVASPTFFLKARNRDAYAVVEKINAVSVTMELDLRASQIEEFDDVSHKKVLDLLSANGSRQTISLDAYIDAMKSFYAWRKDRLAEGLPSHSDAPDSVPQNQRLIDETPLSETNFMPCARPDLTIEMFITCPREVNGGVEVKTLFQKFSRAVARLKCEAELIMWDSDGDGKLTEDDMDGYIKYLIPSISSVEKISQDSIPFYCCAVNRRLFWTVDPSNRASIRIADLIQSPVMDEWLELQLAREDPPRNWFSLTVTTQLYEKFLVLDTNESGMLTAANMKQYKKGIPMVIDDGLPRDVSPLSSLFIDRVFEVTALYKSEMDYKSFVDFVIAVEFLPQCHRPQYFWTIFDLDGSGVLTPITVLHFFRETYQKLVAAGVDAPPLELVMQELFDIVPTKEPLRITREEFMAAPQSSGLLSALMIDCLAFWTYENREHK